MTVAGSGTIMESRTGYVELVVCGLIWGSIGVLVKEITLSASVIVFFRLALGAAAVAVLWAARGRLRELKLRSHVGLLVTSGVVLAIHWLAFFEAYKRLPVSTTILIVYLGPVLIALAAPVVLREPLQARTVWALALSLGGISLIALPSAGAGSALGFAEAGTAAVTFAALVLILKRLSPHYSREAIVVWQLAIAALVLSPSLIGAGGGEITRAAPGLLLLGVVHTGLAGLLYVGALRTVKAQHVSILVYLEPVTAVLWAWGVLGEEPGLGTLAGGALVIAAGLLIVMPGLRSLAAPAALPEPVGRNEIEAR